jgi:hypothetical protein
VAAILISELRVNIRQKVNLVGPAIRNEIRSTKPADSDAIVRNPRRNIS